MFSLLAKKSDFVSINCYSLLDCFIYSIVLCSHTQANDLLKFKFLSVFYASQTIYFIIYFTTHFNI